MKLIERSYSTKMLRPRPLIHSEDDGSLVVIATSWGQPEHGQRALDEVVKYVGAAKSDVEVTSPFEFLACVPDEVNYVRTALLLANDLLYRGENKMEYFSGVEILAMFRRGNMLAWAQVGNPSIFAQRTGKRLQPLQMGLDLSTEFNTQDKTLPPIPTELLGLEPSCNIKCGHSVLKAGEQVVLLSASAIANSLLNREPGKFDLNIITQKMIQEDPEAPFWLGLIDL
ncbi:hypothetical protein [Bdellovibrio sp. HCB2-146]|uniref:hypothetical protein n=1 Tax=Bdellovibrio sp. HCB2-146 TaxID=3394362 RepID=UPI0039BC9D06